jgi:peptidoglycan hydrolase-like protein with peptidoglycan-binding domain
MTIKQKKCLLAYLGYYNGEINGSWNSECTDATVLFQDDYGCIKVDGIVGAETEKALKNAVVFGIKQKADKDFWDEIKYFSREEFRCKCGGKYCNGFPVEPDETMVKYANAIRERLGVPLIPNSGIRCKQHNANVGGVKNSQHVLGNACDLGAPNGITPEKMARVAEEVIGNTGGIGIYSWGIHIDSRPVKARWNG